MDNLTHGGLVSEIANTLGLISVKSIQKDETLQRLVAAVYDYPQRNIHENQPTLQKFVHFIKNLRSTIEIQRTRQGKKSFCTLKSNHPVMQKQLSNKDTDALSDDDETVDPILHPTPMPVEVANEEELKPFLMWLSQNHQPVDDMPLTFLRGTFFPNNGRLDVCKQAFGSPHIGSLCRAVAKSSFVRHFLMGNNIVGADGSCNGAECLAALMKDPNLEIETWYLAGNCFASDSVKVLAAALEKNTKAKALWLKRNPVGAEGAAALGAMLAINRTLCLLDLHNAGLLDNGLRALLEPLLDLQDMASLRHLYLDANGITQQGLAPLLAYLQTPSGRSLRSLSITMNELGDDGLIELTNALRGHPYLKRIALGSNACTEKCLDKVIDNLLTCENLKSVNFGTYKSTADMGLNANWFTVDALAPLVRLVQCQKPLQFLGIEATGLDGEETLAPLLDALSPTCTLYASKCRVVRLPKEAIRLLQHPKRVVHIDSVYRGKM
jgi:Ran GTPase-activating protein (RanGAP) involved in mRNA processing and transport